MNLRSLLCFRSAHWIVALNLTWVGLGSHAAVAGSSVVKFQSQNRYLVIEALDDHLLHFEYGTGSGPSDSALAQQGIAHSEMICPTQPGHPDAEHPCQAPPAGTGHWTVADQGVAAGGQRHQWIQTQAVKVDLNANDLSFALSNLVLGGSSFARISPLDLGQTTSGFQLVQPRASDIYGLGQQFMDAMQSQSDFNWRGRVREGGTYGNAMIGYGGGANGNTQIPIAYFIDPQPGQSDFSIFYDDIHRQKWDFQTAQQTRATAQSSVVRFYLTIGPDLLTLRKRYMDLTGHPLVPPKKMFGLWVSEYGYRNWDQVRNKADALREAGFPVDGFLLDLYWFGGINTCQDDTKMGGLNWDLQNFADPAATVADLRAKLGIGIIPIEEPYIGKNLAEHATLLQEGCLAKTCPTCTTATYFDGNGPTRSCWWGKGGILDYTNSLCADHWQDLKRTPLIQAGVTGFWTDLGEPEVYDPTSSYFGGGQADVTNIYNLHWSDSIARGYARAGSGKRPFILSRSGSAGSQRAGVAMWSGDIGSRPANLATHLANQANLSLSGIDYYGADIGGFHREALDGNLNELFTQWFADAMMIDVPGRTHTDNSRCTTAHPELCQETSPALIGDRASNLANARLRYQLVPYTYSLAHAAYRDGTPVFPPLVVSFESDSNVRGLGHEKMIGPDLLVGTVAHYGEHVRGIYLPAGRWFDFKSAQVLESQGQWFNDRPEYDAQGRFQLPFFARAGALIPEYAAQSLQDTSLWNALGARADGSTITDLVVHAFAGQEAHHFMLTEDDGESTAYLQGEIRTTLLEQSPTAQGWRVLAHGAQGTYAGAPTHRAWMLHFILDDATHPIHSVTLSGVTLSHWGSDPAALLSQPQGWVATGKGEVWVKSPAVDVGQDLVWTLAH